LSSFKHTFCFLEGSIDRLHVTLSRLTFRIRSVYAEVRVMLDRQLSIRKGDLLKGGRGRDSQGGPPRFITLRAGRGRCAVFLEHGIGREPKGDRNLLEPGQFIVVNRPIGLGNGHGGIQQESQ
jgi:hypothetical protein